MAQIGNPIRIQFAPIAGLGFGAIGAGFTAVGTPFTHPIRILKMINETNADVIISFDGVNDHDLLPAGSFTIYDFCANKSEPAGTALMAAGTQVYAATAGAPSSGNVYVVAVYTVGAVN